MAVSYPARVGQGPSSWVVVGLLLVGVLSCVVDHLGLGLGLDLFYCNPLVAAADGHFIIGDHLLKGDRYNHLEALVTKVVYLALEAALHET